MRTFLAMVAILASFVAIGTLVDRPQAGVHSGHGHAPDASEAAAIVRQAAFVRGSEFRAECRSGHRAGNDPIVFPNQTGVSHIHEFFGKAAYWVPTLYKNGVAVAPERVTIYYQGITDPARAVPHPQGLKYVVGNAGATSPDQNPAARWSCVGFPESSRDFLSCPAGSKLETYLDFPTCWDGVRLDSPNHKDHLTWGLGGVGGTCPASHPVVVPRLEFLITYPVNGGGLTLGGTRNGVNVAVIYGTNGNPIQQ